MTHARTKPPAKREPKRAGRPRRLPREAVIRCEPWPLPDFERRNETDEQWAVVVADRQRQREILGAIRALYRKVATDRGLPAKCPRPACRRFRVCSGRRPFPDTNSVAELLPPCVPMDDEHFFGMRDEARPILEALVRRARQAGEAGDEDERVSLPCPSA